MESPKSPGKLPAHIIGSLFTLMQSETGKIQCFTGFFTPQFGHFRGF
jgi:hypothetical protein